MGERTPRRGNNILFSAQQLDHNASKARHLNKRAGNRLQIRKGSLEEQQSTQLQSLDYEMRRLKHELREITQTSGKLEKLNLWCISNNNNGTTLVKSSWTSQSAG